MSKYETIAGAVTRSEAFSKLLHFLDEARDQALVIMHLHRTEDSRRDRALADGWYCVAELLKHVREKIVQLATKGKLH